MRIMIDCRSLLLQKALENFLASKEIVKNDADIIITDKEIENDKSFIIGKDIQKPFSKTQLLLAIEKKFDTNQLEDKEKLDFSLLEKRIAKLTRDYERNIIETIKAFYG